MRYASWSVIIDDIVFPDGRTAMGILGGGGMHTVAGMRVWSADVGLLGKVGVDFDPTMLKQLDLKQTGFTQTSYATPRAWQLFEWDNHRTQIPRMPQEHWTAQLAWPDDFAGLLVQHGVQAVHLLSRGLPGDPEQIARIAGAGIRISLEPIIEEGMDPIQASRVLSALPHVEIFTPGLGEIRTMLGERPVEQALIELAECGPQVIALRQGAAGSLLYHRKSQRMLSIPAAPAMVVDVTGAGNAYAGGLLVGWCESGDLATAASSAAISAAMAIEQIGPTTITTTKLEEAQQRRMALLNSLAQ